MLDALLCEWRDVGRSEQLRRAALRALRSHPLCASDALHLGAALVASGFEPHSIHCRPGDRRLKAAAEREGFVVEIQSTADYADRENTGVLLLLVYPR